MSLFERSTNLVLNHLHNTVEISWSGSHLFPRLIQKLNTDAKEFLKCKVHSEKYRVVLLTGIWRLSEEKHIKISILKDERERSANPKNEALIPRERDAFNFLNGYILPNRVGFPWY